MGALVNKNKLKHCELIRAKEALALTLSQIDNREDEEIAEFLIVYGLTLLSLQDISLGTSVLFRAGKYIPPLLPKIHFWIGEAYSKQSQYAHALKYYKLALAGDKNIHYRLAVAQTRIELDGTNNAGSVGVQELLQLLQEKPSMVEAAATLGIVYSGSKPHQQIGERYLLRALELLPSHRLVLSTLIRLYKHSGRAEEANKLIKSAVAKGVWKRVDQYPAQYISSFSATPWPSQEELSTNHPYLVEAIGLLEANWQEISRDLLTLSAQFLPNPEGAHDPLLGSWDVFSLNCSDSRRNMTPNTCRVLDMISNFTQVSALNAQFLRLQPGGHIRSHCGPTNNRWVVHLGLECPPNVRLLVGGESRGWEQGKCLVFDDSIEHEVIHNGISERVVLGIMFPRFLPPQPCTSRMPWD